MKQILMVGLCLLSFCPLALQAQAEIEFSPDSPGATTGPDIMPLGKVDWETGFSHEWNNRSDSHERRWVINTSTFRLGVTRNAELRLQLDESATHTPTENFAGISNASVGTKIKMYEGKGVLPKVAFLGTLLLPGGSSSRYLPPHLGMQAHLLFENELNDRFSLGYDVGAEWSGDTDNPDLFFGFCLNFQASHRLSLFVENYNSFNSEKQKSWARPGHSSHFNCMSELGAAYMLTSRLQVNAYGDFNLNEPSKYANVGVGVSWLLN